MYPRTLDLARAESAWITPPSERPVACHWCGDHAGDRTATAAHVAVAMPGALSAGDLLCDHCAADLDADALVEDVVTLRREQREADAAEELLLIALQECSCEAWKLWGRTAPEPSLDHKVTAHLLEYGMGRGVDGFVAFGGAL